MIQSNFSDSAIRLIIGWIVGYFMIRLLTNGMFAAEGYAWISGWWLTTCLEMGLALRIWHAFYLLVMCFAVSVSWQVFDVISNSVDIGFPYTAIKLLVHAIVFVSPVYFGAALDRLEALVLKLRGKEVRGQKEARANLGSDWNWFSAQVFRGI